MEGSAGLDPVARRAMLRPVFEQILKDPRLEALERGFEGTTSDVRKLDEYLRFLPLSPLEIFHLDTERKRIDLPVPQELAVWHERWIQLHEKEALELYGEAVVARARGRAVTEFQSEPPPGEVPATLSELLAVGTNRNMAAVFTSPLPLEYQGEVHLAVNPANSTQIVAAANSWDTLCGSQRTLAIFYSLTSGDAWSYTCAPPASAFEPPAFPACTGLGIRLGADPILTWVADNELYLTYLLVCRPNSDVNWSALVVARSQDHGMTWQAHGIVKNSWASHQLEDRPHHAVDRTPQSPFFNRHYTCWDTAAPLANQQKTSYSTDGGETWSAPVNVPAIPGDTRNSDLACDFAISKDGTVHMIWDRMLCAGNSCSSEAMYHTKSINGGASWTTPVLVSSFALSNFSGTNPAAQDDRGIGPFGAIDVDRSGGPCDGTLYVTFGEAGSGGVQNYGDVFVQRSTDGGQTWSSEVKVNDDGGQTLQFHPTLTVDQDYGTLHVAWHDARNDPNHRRVEVYTARSTDCGTAFEANLRVSQPSAEFNNTEVSWSDQSTVGNPYFNPNQYGEYLGLAVKEGQALVSWSDSRHHHPGFESEPQKQNLAFARVTFGAQTRVIPSNEYLDGYVVESSESSNAGGTAVWNGHIRVGDEYSAVSGERQVKGILSFDTSSLPDGAALLSARVDLWDVGLPVGSHPWNTHGPCQIAVKSGPISLSQVYANAIQVEPGDFQAAVTVANAGTLSKGGGRAPYTVTLSPAGVGAILRTGLTQMRISCTLDDNDDNGSDYVQFFDGGWVPAPKLTVTY